MYVNAHIKVLINDTQVYSIVSCEMENDSHNVGATCELVMPLNARIEFNGQDITGQDINDLQKGYVTEPTRYYFNTGDHIQVYAKYEGYESDKYSVSVKGLDPNDKYQLLFDGFLYEFYLSTPIKIKCLDYVYFFNLASFGDEKLDIIPLGKKGKPILKEERKGTGYHKDSILFSALIKDLLYWVNATIHTVNETDDTDYPDVVLEPGMFDMPLVNISFLDMSPASVLEYFKREIGLCITLMNNRLYINVASNTTEVVKLDTGINILKSELQTSNLKKERKKSGSNSLFLKIKLVAYFILDNGKKASYTTGDENGELVNQYFYNVKPSVETESIGGVAVPKNFKALAEEALLKAKQGRFTG